VEERRRSFDGPVERAGKIDFGTAAISSRRWRRRRVDGRVSRDRGEVPTTGALDAPGGGVADGPMAFSDNNPRALSSTAVRL